MRAHSKNLLAGLVAMALGCVAEAAPEPAQPTHGAEASPTPLTSSAATSPPVTTTSAAPPATATATTGVGGGKGPPRSPSGTSIDDDDDRETEIHEAGPMSDTQRAVFRAAARCFEKGLQRGEKPAGSYAIELTIDEAGKVTDVDLAQGYPASIKACIEPKLRGIPFPAEAGGGLRVIRYPMNEVSVGTIDAEP